MNRRIGKVICRIKGKHVLGTPKVIIEGYLFQIACPRCGAFALMTQTDVEEAIMEALTKEGRYTNIERIA